MPVFQQGSTNTTALIVPDLYVQIVPPQVTLLNGIPTNIIGVVGTAAWGPKNVPVTIWNMSSYFNAFGSIQNRKYDMGTIVASAVLQGANNFRCVRVTDGTDVAASSTITCLTSQLATALAAAINSGTSTKRGPSQLVVASTNTTTLTLTAFYTGSLGNSLKAAVSPGSKTGTSKITVSLPGGIPEVFDNIGATSQTYTDASAFTNGSDGTNSVSATTLLGTDVTPRSGMYVLRNTGASIGVLADSDDATSWSTQNAFALAEGIYMIVAGASGQSISSAISAKQSSGIDSYAMKVMHGDWCFFQDTVNSILRLVSPQGFVAGRLANLSPEHSSLNKPIYGIVATQQSSNSAIYSSAELAQLISAGIDVITNPVPGGNYFGCRTGHNSSSTLSIWGDNYTRMTNYVAYTLNAGMGSFIGRLGTPTERNEAWATLDTFFGKMKTKQPEPMIDDYIVDKIPPLENGFQLCNVKVKYLDIVEKFVISVEGGASVQISRIP